MSLGMHLTKYPRYKETTPKQAYIIESYIDWIKNDKKDCNGKKCSFKKWSGHNESEVKLDCVDFYKSKITTQYFDWDNKKKHPYESFQKEVAYWHNAWEIHNWFIENVQDGLNDCDPYEVTRNQLEDLLWTAKDVQNALEYNDIATCEQLLPAEIYSSGEDYGELYAENIEETISNIEKALNETDFENEVLYYCASW